MNRFLLPALLALLTGCSVLPPAPLVHSPDFAPVYPQPPERTQEATGAIYQPRISDNFFGRGRSYRVGDVITVILNEYAQAGRTQSGELSRTSKNDVLTSTLQNRLTGAVPELRGINLQGGTISNTGSGSRDQEARIEGAVAVSVVEVLPNGNLVLRGEKQLALTEGSEVIQVSGIIRPEDVAPNNTVASRRLAHAQISYRGTGDLAAASRPGWATSGLLKLWPF
jgi:flagellar L-ring protein FlgH